jgi:hypothetical protein
MEVIGCYGIGAGGAAAREVLLADAANLPSTTLPRRRRKKIDVHPGDRMKSARERAEEKRAEKLDRVREQVEEGSLVIRKMTAEERRRYPPRAAQPKRPVRR